MIAYLDCFGGLAGDMLLAALLDAGAPEGALRALPERLGLQGVELRLERVERHGIQALHLDVQVEERVGGHERSWPSIRAQLVTSDLEPEVAERSLVVFTRLAEAEAKIHGLRPDDVHFHELGCEDTLVDICGGVTLLAALKVDRLVCSPLPVGTGAVNTAHGVLPLPAPATLELLRGCPVVGVKLEGELVTPTGAAMASTLADAWGPIPAMTVEHIGWGAGARDPAERANVVRVVLGNQATARTLAEISLLETNLDDLNPELVPDAVERCFAAGALDVWTAPVGMKKGRPGIVLSALARPADEPAVARAILEETSALGVRVGRLRRYELDREEQTVNVAGHPLRVKVGRLDGVVVNVAPEHDDCAAVARETGASVKSVWAAALAAAADLK